MMLEVNDQHSIKLHRDRLDLTPVEFRLTKMFFKVRTSI